MRVGGIPVNERCASGFLNDFLSVIGKNEIKHLLHIRIHCEGICAVPDGFSQNGLLSIACALPIKPYRISAAASIP